MSYIRGFKQKKTDSFDFAAADYTLMRNSAWDTEMIFDHNARCGTEFDVTWS